MVVVVKLVLCNVAGHRGWLAAHGLLLKRVLLRMDSAIELGWYIPGFAAHIHAVCDDRSARLPADRSLAGSLAAYSAPTLDYYGSTLLVQFYAQPGRYGMEVCRVQYQCHFRTTTYPHQVGWIGRTFTPGRLSRQAIQIGSSFGRGHCHSRHYLLNSGIHTIVRFSDPILIDRFK